MSLALLILRLGCGIVFLFHGSQILFGAFGGPGPERTAASLHMPAMTGYLVGIAQIAGALAVLTGILIRIGAICIMVVMLGAILKIHLPHGFDVNKGGYEYALTELLIAMALFLTGAGAYSLGSRLPRGLRKL
jgi:putative oxidoreductase